MPYCLEEVRMSAFGQKLKEVREKAGLTQAALAEQAGLHVFGVAKLEQGLREPSWATVRALAHALKVSVVVFDVDELPDKPPAASDGKRIASRTTSGPSGQKSPARGQGQNQKGK